MHNFEKCFIARINNVWVWVRGQIIDKGGWNWLLCKHNGFPYYLGDNYREYPANTPETTLEELAISYNCGELDRQIVNAKTQADQNNLLRGWRPRDTVRQAVDNVLRNAGRRGR